MRLGNPFTIKNVSPHDMHKQNVVPMPRIYQEMMTINYNGIWHTIHDADTYMNNGM